MKLHSVYLVLPALLLSHILCATNYYISNSSGNDNNSGLNANNSWKNISMIDNRVFYAGDRIYLKRGDVWNNVDIELKGSGSPNNLVRLGAYGSGNKPHLKGGGGTVIYARNISNWVVENLKIELFNPQSIDDNTNDHAAPVGIYIRTDYETPQKNIYIENNEIFSSGHYTNTGGIRFRADVPNQNYNSPVIENIWLTGNVIHDLGFFGIRTVSTVGKVAGALKKVRFHNNTLYNLSLQGMVMENVNDGEMKFNLVHHAGLYNGTVQGWGPAGIWPIQSSNILIEENEVHDMYSFKQTDGTGIDIDWGNQYVTVNNNYVHHNHGPGIVILTSDYSVVTNNKVEHNDLRTNPKRGQLTVEGFNGITNIVNQGVKNAYIAFNDIYVYEDDRPAFANGDFEPANTWTNNTFENNKIYLCGNNASAYDVDEDRIQTINNNTIYSASGSYFRGSESNNVYTSITTWQNTTGFDSNSTIQQSTICGSAPSSTYYRIENDGRDWWLQGSGSNSNVYTVSQSSTGDFTRWKKVSAGGNWFYLENKGNGKRLKEGPTMAASSNTGNNMQWQEIDAGNGYKRLQNRTSGKWLQASGSNNGTYMSGTGSTGPWTKWKFVSVSSANARISGDKKSVDSGIIKEISHDLQIYPNPANDQVILRFSTDQQATLTIIDLTGSIVRQWPVTSGKAIDVSALSRGVYLLHLQHDQLLEYRKLIIQQ